MAVKIRLRRMGRTNAPFYRVVAADERAATSGRIIENLGWYDPKKSGRNFELKMDRVAYWIDNGAIMSDTAKSLVKKARKVTPAAAPAEAPADAPAEALADAPGEDTPVEATPQS